jgi:hypothetical protein
MLDVLVDEQLDLVLGRFLGARNSWTRSVLLRAGVLFANLTTGVG